MESKMSILYKLDAQGGFTCGDTETGRTAYAYPTSISADDAKHDPLRVARRMMKHENESKPGWRDAKPYADKDAERMAVLTVSP
jgi:hypothetical protein